LRRYHAIGALLLIATCLAVGGCAAEQRYRVLAFFFDGVPRPGEVQAPADESAAAGDKKPAAEAAVLQVYSHGPYASKNCTACHLASPGGPSMYIPGQKAGSRQAAFGTKIRLPVTELCRDCHVPFRLAELGRRFPFVHGPVAAGACVRCHSPHQTQSPFMVLDQPVRKLCVRCHQAEQLYATAYHAQAKEQLDCTACHDPHGGDRRYFLKPPPAAGSPAATPPPVALPPTADDPAANGAEGDGE